ncbi:hypothetical protein [Vibrio sp. T20]|uniref:hypothetical protein n=1 Tax=Vibrio sp. T20 TaxID=2588450 RepID=UPI0011B3B38D|nr:hypothetical protein [Vibrio sp. T20]
MRKYVLSVTLYLMSHAAVANSWLFSGYAKFGDMEANGSNVTTSLEGYHYSQNTLGRLMLMGEIDSANVGEVDQNTPPFQVTQFGAIQRIAIGQQAAISFGYQNLFGLGESLENRPSIALQYGFKNGLYLSHRTRYHHADFDALSSTTRLDNVIGYAFNGFDTYLQHIYFSNENRNDFQWRVTKQAETFSPFVEIRTQQDRDYYAWVVGVNLSI